MKSLNVLAKMAVSKLRDMVVCEYSFPSRPIRIFPVF